MRIWDVWVGFKGYSFSALVKAETEIAAITQLMKQLDNRAEATPIVEVPPEMKIELENFRRSDETLLIYDGDEI